MTRPSTFLLTVTALASSVGVAAADYPVSGRWTYEQASDPGPAKTCAGRTMEFRGAQRLDTGSGVPQYRNVSVNRSSSSQFAVVDEFFNVQIRGRVEYVLRIIDKDHIELQMQRGKTVALRRCATAASP
jgi:hypothetical protein